MPGIELLKRGIDRGTPDLAAARPIAMLAQEQQEAREVHNVVPLLPRIAQVAQAQPMAEGPLVKIGLGEFEHGHALGIERLDRAEGVVRDVEIDIAPGFGAIRLLEDIRILHAGHAKAPILQAMPLKPIRQLNALGARPAGEPAKEIEAEDAVIGAGQQHARPEGGILCGADAHHAPGMPLDLHGSEPAERFSAGFLDADGQLLAGIDRFSIGSSFHRAGRHAFHHALLRKEEQGGHGKCGQHRKRHDSLEIRAEFGVHIDSKATGRV